MFKKAFGKTGLDVSILGFGCMRLPITDNNDPASIDYDLATRMIRKAIDRGVNYVDTAYPYHSNQGRTAPGASEPFVAHALKDGYRERVSLATKLPTWMVESRKQMNEILDEQLKRLETSHIDFYLAHNVNVNVWDKMVGLGLLDFMEEAKKDGRIKYAGFSFHDHYELFERVIKSYDWDMTQIQYNYLDVNYQAGQRGLKLAAELGVPVSIMEPLRGGFLVDHIPEELQKSLASVRPDWTMADWGLRWVMNQPGVGVVLSGMTAMSHVDDNIKIAETLVPLSERETEALSRVRDYFHARLKVDCTGCGYCMPCSSGVDIPKNFLYYNDYFLMDSPEIQQRSKYYYGAQVGESERASNCVHCHECEEKCPQGLAISDMMEDVCNIFCSK
ncbi:aldo/keto reductase [Deltaproteobacteria bacterium Smac51]|nr:aldo/keto reductase [Deltaproteobacteria bacterium Smac51]